MSSYKGIMEQIFILFFINVLLIIFVTSSQLPKYVDQQLNNQANEAVSSVMLPLQSMPCLSSISTSCFMIDKFPQPHQHDWQFLEFQVSAHSSAIQHSFKLIIYDGIPEISGNNIIFASVSLSPDPILMDIIINITPAKINFLRQNRSFYFQILCVDCSDQPTIITNENAIAFIIIKPTREKRRRLRRAIENANDCSSDNHYVHCCIEKTNVAKQIIFDNSSRIIGPSTVPVSYCRGECYVSTYQGNHNQALIRYIRSLPQHARNEMRKHLPCCSATEFRDLEILYLINGVAKMERSSRFIIASCKCH